MTTLHDEDDNIDSISESEVEEILDEIPRQINVSTAPEHFRQNYAVLKVFFEEQRIGLTRGEKELSHPEVLRQAVIGYPELYDRTHEIKSKLNEYETQLKNLQNAVQEKDETIEELQKKMMIVSQQSQQYSMMIKLLKERHPDIYEIILDDIADQTVEREKQQKKTQQPQSSEMTIEDIADANIADIF